MHFPKYSIFQAEGRHVWRAAVLEGFRILPPAFSKEHPRLCLQLSSSFNMNRITAQDTKHISIQSKTLLSIPEITRTQTGVHIKTTKSNFSIWFFSDANILIIELYDFMLKIKKYSHNVLKNKPPKSKYNFTLRIFILGQLFFPSNLTTKNILSYFSFLIVWWGSLLERNTNSTERVKCLNIFSRV